MPFFLRACASLLLAAAYTLAAVAPCAPVLEEVEDGLPFPASVERLASWQEAREAEPPVSVGAECPCGCEKKSPVSSGGAGFALARPTPEAPRPAAGFELAARAPVAPPAPGAPPEPVPI